MRTSETVNKMVIMKTVSNVLKSEADQGFVIPWMSVSVGFL